MSNEGIDFKVDKRSGIARVAVSCNTNVSPKVTMEMSLWEAKLVIRSLIGEYKLSERQDTVAQYIGAKMKKEMYNQIMSAAKAVKPLRDEASALMAELESSEEWNDMLQDAARDFDTEEYFED